MGIEWGAAIVELKLIERCCRLEAQFDGYIIRYLSALSGDIDFGTVRATTSEAVR